MVSVNKAFVAGNLGQDPELRYTQSGTAVCNLSVGTNESWTDKASGQKKNNVTWHTIVAWGALGENCAKYLKKGSAVHVEGRLQTRSWEKNGEKRYATEIVAEKVQFLSSSQPQEARDERQQAPSSRHQNSDRDYDNQNYNRDSIPDDIPF